MTPESEDYPLQTVDTWPRRTVRCFFRMLFDSHQSMLRRSSHDSETKETYHCPHSLRLANAVVPAANAMHIMEGYLPATFCVAWGILCLPFLFAGFFSIQKTLRENRRKITLLAMSGAFIFVISSLKIPSLTGSCSHMTGTGLGAILFGPFPVAVLGLMVLLFQALLLAHGGSPPWGQIPFPWLWQVPFLPGGSTGDARSCI